MRIATEELLPSIEPEFTKRRSEFAGISSEMLAHPIAGRSLRNFLILTENFDLFDELRLSDDERFWSRYYWLARFVREWKVIAGIDAGLEHQVFQLLENASVDLELLSAIDAAVERDAAAEFP